MRRSYISPEFDSSNVYGTLNMREDSCFLGSKMLEIEDIIYVQNQNIIYYQKFNGEQIDYSSETSLDSIIYSSENDKFNNHTLKLDNTQTQYNLENSTKWIIDIDVSSILSNFIYSEIKKHRSFEGFKTEMSLENDVNSSVKNYVSLNVKNRYKFKSIDLYLSYVDLRSQNVLRYKNIWNPNIDELNKFTKIQTITDYTQSKIRVLFSQEKSSSLYRFDYFFNILFEKI